MRTNLYLKAVISIIAIELFILIIKSDINTQFVSIPANSETLASSAKYSITNDLQPEVPEIINVKIVGVELPPKSRDALPVLLYNVTGYDGKLKPIQVQVQQPIKVEQVK